MAFALGPRAAQAGFGIVSHERLDSTNSEAMRLARQGECGPLWIVARAQEAGRGRRGREWISLPGNLAASLLVTGVMTALQAATLGFVAGLSLCEAIRESAPGIAVALKWPNDVLAGEAKVAGILLESEKIGMELAAVVGFGVNLASAPQGMAYPATSLKDMAHDVPIETFFKCLTDAWVKYDSVWNRGDGFGDIRTLWLEQARGINSPISVRMNDRTETGIFETLDEQGRLILRAADGGVRAISAGDVYFGDAATGPAAGALS